MDGWAETVLWHMPRCTQCRRAAKKTMEIGVKALTEKVGEERRLSVKLDGDEDGVEEDEDNDEPVEHLRLDDMSNFEPSTTST